MPAPGGRKRDGRRTRRETQATPSRTRPPKPARNGGGAARDASGAVRPGESPRHAGAKPENGRGRRDKERERPARDRIIDAALALFYENGYHPTGLADICRRAGVNAGSLYYFFKTKRQVLLAVLDRYVELLRPAVMDPAFAGVDDPVERIFSVLARYRENLLMARFNYGCPIGNLALEVADEMPDAREKIALNFANWCRAIEECLDEAAERLPTDLDRPRLARFVLTTMEGGLMQCRAHRRIEPYDDAVAQLRDYFDRLLSEPRARSSGPRSEP
jgi:TetR/AcrR family transcriptional repressor of nem operon